MGGTPHRRLAIAEPNDWRPAGCACFFRNTGLEGSETQCRARLDLYVESPINVNQPFPQKGEPRPTAAAAALGGDYHGFDETVIQTIQELPGTAITHVEAACCLRQRAATLDLLE